jgi:hypothetical protein
MSKHGKHISISLYLYIYISLYLYVILSIPGGNDHPVSRLHPGSVFGGQAVLGISQTRKETVMATRRRGDELRSPKKIYHDIPYYTILYCYILLYYIILYYYLYIYIYTYPPVIQHSHGTILHFFLLVNF